MLLVAGTTRQRVGKHIERKSNKRLDLKLKIFYSIHRYDSDWVDRYNPVTDQWRACSPMSVPRNRVGVAVMDGLLYAVGGSAGAEYHSSVECYDPDLDAWNNVEPMHIKRLGVGVAMVNR